MSEINSFNKVRRLALVAACAPLVLLAGCPKDPPAAPGKVPAQATAPAATSAPGPQTQPAMTTAQSVDNAAKAYKVQQLINTAEKEYRSGVDNYRAGHLDAARVDFDSAVDLM
ncbi:MAG TPA: hypothetical protein VIX42_04825, partial [Edaphobacter sp.]